MKAPIAVERLAARVQIPAVTLLAVASIVAAALWLPARGAGAWAGVVAGAAIAAALQKNAEPATRRAVFWVFLTVAADAAYARLNDLAPVTLASALTKVADAGLKLADPLLKGLSPAGMDLRTKLALVTTDFVWALILTLIVVLGLALTGRGRA